ERVDEGDGRLVGDDVVLESEVHERVVEARVGAAEDAAGALVPAAALEEASADDPGLTGVEGGVAVAGRGDDRDVVAPAECEGEIDAAPVELGRGVAVPLVVAADAGAGHPFGERVAGDHAEACDVAEVSVGGAGAGFAAGVAVAVDVELDGAVDG